MDIMFFGSSRCYSTYSPAIIKERTQYQSYALAMQQQPIATTYYLMKEAFKSQSPKYVFLEYYMATKDEIADSGIRSGIDKMKFSINKIEAVNSQIESKQERLDYYLPLLLYHNRWDSLTVEDLEVFFNNTENSELGYTKREVTPNVINYKDISFNDEVATISEINEKYLKKIFELSDQYNFELVLVLSPTVIDDNQRAKLNYIENLAQDYGIEFIDFSKIIVNEKLDLENFFYDYAHTSEIGASYISNYISEYLLRKINN